MASAAVAGLPIKRQEPSASDVALERSIVSLLDSAFTPDQTMLRIERLEWHFRRAASKAQCEYVLKSVRSFKEFVFSRKHLWASFESMRVTSVQKQDDDFRRMIFQLSTFMQGTETKAIGGLRLKEISTWFDREAPNIGRRGQGLDATRNFLFRHPLLFELFDSRHTDFGDFVYSSLAWLIDGMLMLPEHVESTGKVAFVNYRQTFGIIKFRNTDDEAYFPVRIVQKRRYERSEEIVQRVAVFGFTAVVSWKYLLGKATNKWTVVKMWPLDEEEEEASKLQPRVGLDERKDQDEEAEEEEEEEEEENPEDEEPLGDFSPRNVASSTTSSLPADPSPEFPVAESLKKPASSKKDPSVSGTAPLYAAKFGESSKPKPRWADLASPSHGKDARGEPAFLQAPTAAAADKPLSDFLELLSMHFPPLVRSNRFGEVIDEEKTDLGKSHRELKQAAKQAKKAARRGNDQGEDQASCSTDQDDNNGALQDGSKRDVGCQTDFGNNRELLLQAILSNSEQLVELIRIAKSSGANL